MCRSSYFPPSFTEYDPAVTLAVRNLSPDVDTDDLENYFENRRHSDGGPVAKITCEEESGTTLIEFENAEGML